MPPSRQLQKNSTEQEHGLAGHSLYGAGVWWRTCQSLEARIIHGKLPGSIRRLHQHKQEAA
jgi:hypothetical protein